MSKWEAPLLGRKVQVFEYISVVSQKAKHWWNWDQYRLEKRPTYIGEVVDRSPVSAQYLIAGADGKLRWVWSSDLKIINE